MIPYGRDYTDEYGEPLPEPTPLARREKLPPFPVGALPEPLAAMVAAVAEFTQTDAGMAGTTALAMLAAAAGGRAEVEVRPGWREPLSLYTATVAGPGERKSAVQAAMTRPLVEVEAELAAAGASVRLEAETTRAVAARAAELAKIAAGGAQGEERDWLLAEAIQAAATAEAVVVPVIPRISLTTSPRRPRPPFSPSRAVASL